MHEFRLRMKERTGSISERQREAEMIRDGELEVRETFGAPISIGYSDNDLHLNYRLDPGHWQEENELTWTADTNAITSSIFPVADIQDPDEFWEEEVGCNATYSCHQFGMKSVTSAGTLSADWLESQPDMQPRGRCGGRSAAEGTSRSRHIIKGV
jgi:hypothetical protein